ncbi:MAG: hypothetical protein GY778_12965, partial [bacterium]|nr:hypothetical protein [bacterium]
SRPPRYTPERERWTGPSSILDPRLPPDGQSLTFTAAGHVWRQALEGALAQRLLGDEGFRWGAAVLSPDGRKLAYQKSVGNLQRLEVADLKSGDTAALVAVDRTGRFEPAWGPDGRQLVYVGFKSMVPSLFVVDVQTGQRRKLVGSFPRWMPRPHFSADGAHVFYTDRNQIRRHSVRDGGEPEPVTRFTEGHVADGMVSPDGQWLAFRRNEEIWV